MKKYNTINHNVFFTADEHYYHKNIIKYAERPFNCMSEMNEKIIENHNSIVKNNDIVFHIGDFSFVRKKSDVYQYIINKLNGNHIFIKGSHDYWIKDKTPITLLEIMVNGYHITMCHYCLRTWPRSHYNSWHLYGHSHGKLPSIGKSHDVGVDNNNFYPFSFDDIKNLMDKKDNNPNFIKR